ncbi:MAG: TetR/AcrR family transcriptional regulator [Beijerinckiaceae bacterium]|nr:TetR/AcrR family transcriptional regulator [Beijerinckiaceae bacterium]
MKARVTRPEECQRGRAVKRQAITSAAADMFLSAGFAATSIEGIAERAGVSRQTVYNCFDSKDGLFHAICSDLVDEIIAPIARAAQDQADLRHSLVTIGENLLAKGLRPKNLALYRLIVTESARFPELGRSLYMSGPRRAVTQLADFFRAEMAHGRLHMPDAEIAAEHFFGMLNGHNQLRALMGVAARPSAARRRAIAEAAADTFLRAFAPRAAQPAS